jgi:hypothetical protein
LEVNLGTPYAKGGVGDVERERQDDDGDYGKPDGRYAPFVSCSQAGTTEASHPGQNENPLHDADSIAKGLRKG